MNNFVQAGKTLQLVAPYTRTSGQGAKVGALFGVATVDVTSGSTAEFLMEGVCYLIKATGAWSQGDRIYWDDSAKNCTTTATAGMFVGVATAAALSGDTSGYVKLNEAPSEFAEGQQAAIAALTDNSGGTSGGNTIALLSGVDGTASNAAPLAGTKNAIATLAAKVNALQAALHAAGITA